MALVLLQDHRGYKPLQYCGSGLHATIDLFERLFIVMDWYKLRNRENRME